MDVLINLDVDDLEKAVRFYADAFGLRLAPLGDLQRGNVGKLGSHLSARKGHGFCFVQFLSRGYDEISVQ